MLLTIGIPTYNCWQYLEPSLTAILGIIAQRNDIEVLVCDNCSRDSTQRGIEALLSSFPEKLRYIRHPNNLGMDRNFWSIVVNARGRFVHFLGDDDFYLPDGLFKLVDVIERHDPTVCALSNNYLNTISGKAMTVKDDAEPGRLYHGVAVTLVAENLRSLVLSNIVIKRSACENITGIEKYFNCNWLHLAIFLEALKKGGYAYVFSYSDPILSVRIGNQRWVSKGGAMSFYLDALALYCNMPKAASSAILRLQKLRILNIIQDAQRMKYDNLLDNVKLAGRFLATYWDFPVRAVIVALKLLFFPRRQFFDGWESI